MAEKSTLYDRWCMTKNRIIGIVTAVDGDDLLPHFAAHYFRLGMEELHVVVSQGSRLHESAEQLSRSARIVVHPVHRPVMGEEIKTHTERDILSGRVTADDWLLHLDLDEFHEYPKSLPQIAAAMEKADVPLVAGEMVDRVSEDGGLHAIQPSPSIFQQFPIGCSITRSWLCLPTTKIMLCRGWVQLYYGRHHAENAGFHAPVIGTERSFRVHHFKWFAGIDRRLRDRSNQWEAMDPWYQERNREFADSIIDNRIDPQSVPDREWLGEYQYGEKVGH